MSAPNIPRPGGGGPSYPNTGQYIPQKSVRMSEMMYPDPMFYPGYYPNSGVNVANQQNPAYLGQARNNLVSQFDEEFDAVMNGYNKKMAQLQLMKNDLQNQKSYEPPRYVPYKSKRMNHMRELLDVVDTPIKQGYNRRVPSGDIGNGRSNYINKMMFDSDKNLGGKFNPNPNFDQYNEYRGPNHNSYNSNISNSQLNPEPYRNRNLSMGGGGSGFDIDDFVMGRR